MTEDPPPETDPRLQPIGGRSAQVATATRGRVVVFGGTGVFGQLAAQLTREQGVPVTITGRDARRGERIARRLGVEFRTASLREPDSIDAALDGAVVAVNCIGPFQEQPLIILGHCLARGVHYADISDSREHARRVRELAIAAQPDQITVMPGLSTVPCISGCLVRWAAARLDRIDRVLIALAPGNRNPRGAATIASLLTSAGDHFTVPAADGWREVAGWTEPERVDFGKPMGPRIVRLVDSPDYDLLPPVVGAAAVEFKAGLELRLLNAGVASCARPRDSERRRRLARVARLLSLPLYPFGTPRGCLLVIVTGRRDGRTMEVRGRVLASSRPLGPVVVATPAAVAAARLATGALTVRGLVSPFGWCEPDALFDELRNRGAQVDLTVSQVT